MADAAANQADQSMEEILQSIKRIIAEDDASPAALPADAPAADDVLELTQQVNDDGIVTEPSDQPINGEVAPMALEALLDSLAVSGPPVEETPVEMMPAEAPVVAPAQPPAPADAGLVDNATVASAALAMQRLASNISETPHVPTSHGLAFRSGATVEDLVLEALRPMLKEWLDANLSQTVERLVAKEVARISQRVS
jgi:uncharacterized protein